MEHHLQRALRRVARRRRILVQRQPSRLQVPDDRSMMGEGRKGQMKGTGRAQKRRNPNAVFVPVCSWAHDLSVRPAESAPCVGVCVSPPPPSNNDTGTALDNYRMLQNFFELFPEYNQREFYIAGESYAGTCVNQGPMTRGQRMTTCSQGPPRAPFDPPARQACTFPCWRTRSVVATTAASRSSTSRCGCRSLSMDLAAMDPSVVGAYVGVMGGRLSFAGLHGRQRRDGPRVGQHDQLARALLVWARPDQPKDLRQDWRMQRRCHTLRYANQCAEGAGTCRVEFWCRSRR